MHYTEDNGPNSYLKVRADADRVAQSLYYPAGIYAVNFS